MPDPLRPFLGIIGLALGLGLYTLSDRLPPPWNHALVGLYFLALGGAALVYARGERWIQVLGALLIVYGLLRALVLR